MSSKQYRTRLVIIGSGPAGLSAAIYAGRAHLQPIVLEGDKPGGQLMGTTLVENWPGTQQILGPDLMRQMQEHARACGATLLADEAITIETTQRPFHITTKQGSTILADTIIVATGAVPKRLNVPGESDYWGKGVSSCAVCDGVFYKDKKVVVVGGGDTAMEVASFLTKFTKQITVVHILAELTASATMQERVLNNSDIKIIYNSTVTEIKGDGSHVTQVTISNQKDNSTQSMDVDGVFIAIGYTPKTDMFKNALAVNAYGYLEVTDHTKTSIAGIFAAGDVADYRYRQAITSAGSGCMASLDAERFLHTVNHNKHAPVANQH